MTDDLSMAGLFSERVVTLSGVPASLDDGLHPVELASVERAVEKRRQEFAAGRTLARRALRQLGIGDVAIPVGEKREPVWPAGIVGSISHTRGFCGVAVARAVDVRGLGFDVERVSDLRPELQSHLVAADELASLQRALGLGIEHALALAFSGKEAFFKYQYPLTRTWAGLRDVEVRASPDGFQVVSGVDLGTVCAKGGVVAGRYSFQNDYVMTGIEVDA